MYWIAYRQGGLACVMIVEADSLVEARLKADIAVPGVDERFISAHEFDRSTARFVPAGMTSRLLGAGNARRLLDRIDVQATRKSAGRRPAWRRLRRT